MGASDMPYLYDPPAHRRSQHVAYPYSDFNPKAVTEASYKRLSQQTTNSNTAAKKEGPLINFNAHPDSYVVFEGSSKEHKPLPAGTKKAVVVTRWLQFVLRLLQEICALGLLTATICVKNTKGAETYLLRIPQAWDSLIGLYAIYHLLRPAKGRTPSSSAAYHTFALVMDVALIPLYVYITLLVNTNRHLPEPQYSTSGDELDGDWRWTSFFDVSGTNLLLMVTYLAAAVIAGLHFFSCAFDLYLIIVFRKISHLPPDMNPLEDNLTRRPTRNVGGKHKYKNSEITLQSNGSMSEIDQKKLAHLSGSTLSVGEQSFDKRASSIMDADGQRQMPFGHSRNESKTSVAYSPHNPETARWSRHQYDGQQAMYQEAVTNPRRSRYEVRPDGKLEVRTRGSSHSPVKRDSAVVTPTGTMAQANRNSFVAPPDSPARSSYHTSQQIPASPDRTTTSREASPNVVPNFSRAGSPKAQLQGAEHQQLLNDNWYVLDADDDDMGSPSRSRTPATIVAPATRNGYSAIPGSHDRHDSFEPVGRSQGVDVRDMVPQPLGMHPPTPPIPAELEHLNYPDPDESHLQTGDGVNRSGTQSSSIYSESAPSLKSSKGHGPGTPKGRFYGDLNGAMRGVRGADSPYGSYGLPPSPQPSRTPSPEKKARVISRTGADIADESVLYVNESKYSMRNRRDVSGKVAEEGRGGSWGRKW